jgi:hypothetical protein
MIATYIQTSEEEENMHTQQIEIRLYGEISDN